MSSVPIRLRSPHGRILRHGPLALCTSMRAFGAHLLALGIALPMVAVGAPARADETIEPVAETNHFEESIAPFLAQYCLDCHSSGGAEGGVALDRFTDSANVQEEYALWEKILRLVSEQQMPPADMEQPTGEEILAIRAAIERELATFDCSSESHPGRVTIRRLNKAEYNNTIRDLVGLELSLADDFPSDDVGHGFDNIADVLSIPPILLEKYLDAAYEIADRVWEDEEARRRVFPHQAESDDQRLEAARRNLRDFASRAFRRPVTDEEHSRLMELVRFAWEQDASEEDVFKTAIVAILSNPHFIFRIEQDPSPEDADGIRELNDYELATRLSYFLWSSMPDERLFELAERGELRNREVLAAEAQRMLADPKARALVDNFAGQWLQLRDVSRFNPDPDKFPEFDGELRAAMRRETELFFETIVREDRSVLEFLTADYTYVNERLAAHYGIPDVTGDHFRRVTLGNGRRGVLTHASILMLTSNPTRTSPVKRGKWILDNILGEPPPPPPPDVPELEEGGETLGSQREQLEQHRANPACAVCHTTMDELGFGLENFDVTGAWRDRDGRFDVDSSGQLPGGRSFTGAAELMEILVEEKNQQFTQTLASKLLTYALGRGLESYDRCTVQNAVESLKANDYRFGSLVAAIVTSDPFTMREAKRER